MSGNLTYDFGKLCYTEVLLMSLHTTRFNLDAWTLRIEAPMLLVSSIVTA